MSELTPQAQAPSPDPAPIFIVGTGRSGTTLLRLMLSAHPRIHIAHEASFYIWRMVFGRRLDPAEFVRRYLQTFSFRWLGVTPQAPLAGLPWPPTVADLPRFHRGVMRAVADRFDKPRYGDKTPGHAGALRELYADFPDARVIHIVRDPRGVVLSLSRMPWASKSLVAGAVMVEAERQQVKPFRDRLLTVRLEDLLAQPEPEMRRVLEFVGEPFDAQVLDHAAHGPPVPDMPPFPWLTSARARRGAPSARWPEALSPKEIRLLEHMCRHSLSEYGYEPATLPAEPGRLAVSGAWLRGVPEALRFAWLYARVGLRSRDPATFESEASARLLARLNPDAWAGFPGFEMPTPPPLPEGWELTLQQPPILAAPPARQSQR